MVKKKRQSDPQSDSSSTESNDDKQNGLGSSTNANCQHIAKSVDPTKLKKILKSTGIELESCIECSKESNLIDSETFEYDKTLWLCMKCGSQLCGRSKNSHALTHFETPRSDSHALAMNTTAFDIWCYCCDQEVNLSHSKKLAECVEYVKKLKQTKLSLNTNGNPYNNIEPNNMAMNYSYGYTISPSRISDDNLSNRKILDSLPRVKGLSNIGNTCFFNAVMQCLSQTPYLLDILLEASEPGEEFTLPGGNFVFKNGMDTELSPIEGKLNSWGGLTHMLADTLQELKSGGGVFTPQKLFNKLVSKCPSFGGGDQHDAHELLRHLLESVRSEDLQRYQKVILEKLGYNNEDVNTVSDDMKQKCKIYGQQAADRILRPEQVFRGFLVSTLTCQDCYHTSSCHENFLDLSLPVSVEKPQPPIRRKGSPEATSSGLMAKYHSKKEKDIERKATKAKKNSNKRLSLEALIAVGPSGDNTLISTDNNVNSCSNSSAEQSDADVEDNVIEDTPKYVDNSQIGNKIIPLYDNNGNNQIVSPVNFEKRDDSPENNYKNSNDDENDSGIVTSPTNTTALKPKNSNSLNAKLRSNVHNKSKNLVIEFGISEKGANLIRQRTLSSGNEGNDLATTNIPTTEFEQLSLNEKQQFLAAKQKAKIKRNRTQSYSDWSTTIAPRYQCTDGECSIQSCLNNFTAVELMTGNNKVGCDGCTKRINGENGKTVYTNATKQFLISSPPAVLILHLKRFQVGPRSMFRKLSRHVSFPMILDIAPFCGSKVKNLPNIDKKQKKLLYALYGIVEHAGGMYGGHYTAYVKVRPELSKNDPRWKFLPQGSKAELDQADEQKVKLEELLAKEKAREMRMKENDSDDYPSTSSSSSDEAEIDLQGAVGGSDEPIVKTPIGKWYLVSDSRVQEVSEETVLNVEAYLLFYERIY